jgi:hypothetical protein
MLDISKVIILKTLQYVPEQWIPDLIFLRQATYTPQQLQST